jgi:hypothetical protein
MRDEVPSLLKTKNEEKFCQDVTVRRKMREEFDKTLGLKYQSMINLRLYLKSKTSLVI